MKITYKTWNPRTKTRELLDAAINAIDEEVAQGYKVSVRQVYYKLVAFNVVGNNPNSYQRVCRMLADARRAGMVDWDHIEDRGRQFIEWPTWENPEHILRVAVNSFRRDLWETQPLIVECWVEKNALGSVIAAACKKRRVPQFQTRGYSSITELWNAAERIKNRAEQQGKPTVVLYLGDHDPSGLNIRAGIPRALEELGASSKFFDYRPLGITLHQTEELQLPPLRIPTEKEDSRKGGYIARHGEDYWELDAMPSKYMRSLIEEAVEDYIDTEAWNAAVAEENADMASLTAMVESVI